MTPSRPDTHPEELLAGLVDGSIGDGERAVVEAHLATCEACREEIELARGAVRALAELPDEPVPLGTMDQVTAELGRRMRRPGRTPWASRLQWAGGLAAAAALVAALVVTLPRLGGESARRAVGGGGGAAAPALSQVPSPEASTARVQLEDQSSVDYDAARLESLSSSVAAEAVSGAGDAGVEAPTDLIPAATGDAEACLAEAASPTPNDRLVRLITASYEGTPAYLGVYLESPGAGQPPTKVVVWVAAKQGCRILAFSQRSL